ncbi:MAG: glutaredoxin family protein [Cellulomonas sp.]|nr:glutaredoxin family protein [Cellulomonas sp.]
MGGVDEPRVTLYNRVDCHLCDDARAVVREVCAQTGDAWRELDVDVPDRDGHVPADELGDLVPVVLVDGVQVGHWRIEPDRLRRALARDRTAG